ncbi:hypothetical protein HOY80DRAFT_744632 [Tuber brumale]|nr:hypothetical protein HOY80DRAFT_744632 [Tuber brumale]
MMSKPNIISHFRGGMEQLKTADGTTLYAYKSILDSGAGFCPDSPWGSFTTPTVERFLEHCYQGDYSSPKPAKLPLATPTSSLADGDGVFHIAAGHLFCPTFANGQPAPQDGRHVCSFCVSIQDHDAEADEGNNGDGAEVSDTEYGDDKDDSGPSGHPDGLDYFEVFFAHAELYILSQTQGRSPLTALCLERLHTALEKAAKAPIRSRFATNLSHLLLYVYEHNNVKLIDDNRAHDIQNLASSYAAIHIEDTKEECSLLMRHGGKMAEDLMKGVADRAIDLNRVLEMEMQKMEIAKTVMGVKEMAMKMEMEREKREREREKMERKKMKLELEKKMEGLKKEKKVVEEDMKNMKIMYGIP